MNDSDSLLSRDDIQNRLFEIFPEGSAAREYCTRKSAASTVFVALYMGAIEGTGTMFGPKQITKFSDEQSALRSRPDRLLYVAESVKTGYVGRGTAWYADNTREPIRDETLRKGYMLVGAVVEDKSLPTTSPKPRYALAKDFAALFDSALVGPALTTAIEKWREAHLSGAARARLTIVRAGRAKDPGGITAKLPNGDTIRLASGESSKITKHVLEEFTRRFLSEPAVVWVSESGNKVVTRDDLLARSFNLVIDPARNLPDVILADVVDTNSFLLVFVEVVASDGPISEDRRKELLRLTAEAEIAPDKVAFVTAYLDRDGSPLKKNLPDLAWNSFVWVASEPDNIIGLHRGTGLAPRLSALLQGEKTPKG